MQLMIEIRCWTRKLEHARQRLPKHDRLDSIRVLRERPPKSKQHAKRRRSVRLLTSNVLPTSSADKHRVAQRHKKTCKKKRDDKATEQQIDPKLGLRWRFKPRERVHLGWSVRDQANQRLHASDQVFNVVRVHIVDQLARVGCSSPCRQHFTIV